MWEYNVHLFINTCYTDSRVAVWELVVSLVCLHGQLEVTYLTREASLVPCLL